MPHFKTILVYCPCYPYWKAVTESSGSDEYKIFISNLNVFMAHIEIFLLSQHCCLI